MVLNNMKKAFITQVEAKRKAKIPLSKSEEKRYIKYKKELAN